jgi:copper transport protein
MGRRIATRLLPGLLLGCGLALAAPATPAAAHANLLETDPPAGSVLSEIPTEVTLTFSEPVRLVPDRVLVVGPDGDRVDAADPVADGPVVTIPLGDGAGALGTYLVSFRVISQDNHPVPGSVTFSVGAPSETPVLVGGGETGDPLVAVAVSANKYAGYAGLVLLIGPAVALARLWPSRLPRRGAARLLWTGLGLVTASTVAGIWLQAPYSLGEPLSGAGAGDVREVLSTTYGTALVVRLGVLVAVAILLRPLLAGRAERSDLVLLAGLGVVGLGTWSVAGHPVASPIPAVSIAAQTVHLAAAAFWVGGLVAVAGFLLRRADERELRAILPVWSQWAASAVVVLMAAGTVRAVVEVGVPGALVTTSYGRLLLVKLGLFAVVIAVAGYSRRLVRSRLGASRPRAMRTAVMAEAAVLAIVLVVSSILVQTTPGRTEVNSPERAAAATDFNQVVESDLFSLQVLVEPAELGTNRVHLYVSTLEGEPARVREWRATAALPAANLEPVDIPVLPLTDDHATGQVTMSAPGDWELKITLRMSAIDQASVDVTVPIE